MSPLLRFARGPCIQRKEPSLSNKFHFQLNCATATCYNTAKLNIKAHHHHFHSAKHKPAFAQLLTKSKASRNGLKSTHLWLEFTSGIIYNITAAITVDTECNSNKTALLLINNPFWHTRAKRYWTKNPNQPPLHCSLTTHHQKNTGIITHRCP